MHVSLAWECLRLCAEAARARSVCNQCIMDMVRQTTLKCLSSSASQCQYIMCQADIVIWWSVVALLQDHHCLFLGTCIGRRNHRHFLLVMIWAILGCLYAAICCACLLARRRHQVPF